MKRSITLLVAAIATVLFQTAAAAQFGPTRTMQAGGPPPPAPVDPNPVTPGELLIEPPTLINLAFEWFIEGDDNRNASVAVSYRKKGATAWSPALPLLRLHGERIYSESRIDVITPNMFSGSILDLEPATAYDARLVMSDPDGVRGIAERVVTVQTRPEPQPYAGGRVFHVYPHGFKGAKAEPSFEGLMCAYNFWCAGTDWATAGRPRVRPGDTIMVHAGTYKYNRYEYTNDPTVNRTVPLDGTYFLTADGTPDMPIAIIGAGDGEVIFDGNGAGTLFDVRAADYTYFEGITFTNAEVAILAGTQFIAGSKGLSVKRSSFTNVGAGIFTNFAGSSNFYVADSRFVGRNDPTHVIGWAGNFWTQFNGVNGQRFPPPMSSYVAVKLYGPGHVVAFNYITDFHDGINVETYGNPDGSVASGPGIVDGPRYPTQPYWDRRPVAIDFYNNYISNSHDNPIETDGSMHNIRVMRNMLINHASHALCNQPTLGGPIYWIRNIAYHLPGGSTRLTGGAAGVLFYNNTILSETSANGASNVHWRNNLILGENSQPAIFAITTFTNYTSSDYNGYRVNPGSDPAFQWTSPGAGIRSDYPRPNYSPKMETRRFATLEAFAAGTGQDTHSVPVDYDIFLNVPRLDAQDLKTVQNVLRAEDFDFRLKAGSAAVDRGTPLANITDGFGGKAPDLGALEAGQTPPHYGPRPKR